MANKRTKPSNVNRKVAQEHLRSINEACANIDGRFVVNHSNDQQPTITQSCATPPRPTGGSDKK